MLVLARHTNQKIMIGDDIVIMVTDVNLRTGKVKLGIEAPSNLPVHREEVYEAIIKSKADVNRRTKNSKL